MSSRVVVLFFFFSFLLSSAVELAAAPQQPAQAWLFETTATVRERHTWFGRVEIVEKPAHDLHAHELPFGVFTVGKLQAGYVRHLDRWRGLVPGVGATASVSLVPAGLSSRYDGRVAPGLVVFVSLRPAHH